MFNVSSVDSTKRSSLSTQGFQVISNTSGPFAVNAKGRPAVAPLSWAPAEVMGKCRVLTTQQYYLNKK